MPYSLERHGAWKANSWILNSGGATDNLRMMKLDRSANLGIVLVYSPLDARALHTITHVPEKAIPRPAGQLHYRPIAAQVPGRICRMSGSDAFLTLHRLLSDE
jgi:hypothetical protein